MEPKTPEQLPSPIEFTLPMPNVERPPASVERGEPTPERSQEQQQMAMPSAIPINPVPVAPVQTSTSTGSATLSDDNPQLAADEDLIEKEWVDKAKKVIADTVNDPYAREREVGKLQADYLKKRYGKELGNQT